MNKKLLLIGGGGHCKSVLDSVLGISPFDDIGIVDTIDKLGDSLMGIKIIGTDNDLPKLYQLGFKEAVIAIGSIGNPNTRIKFYYSMKEVGYNFPNIIDSTAIVSEFTVLTEGIYIGKGAIVNSSVNIEKCSIINTGAVLEHDCNIGQFAHVASNTVLCGNVKVGNNAHIGAGSVVKQGLIIGNGAVIGIGSTVVANIPPNTVAYGNPCKVIKKI